MNADEGRFLNRVYRLSLRLLPEPFRSQHSDEMVRLFSERVGDTAARSALAAVGVVIREVLDVVATARRLRRASVRTAGLWNVRGRVVGLAGDLRAGGRAVLRRRSRSVMALTVIALAIAATTSVFAIVDAVALRPLPHERPERLVVVSQTVPSLGDSPVPMAWLNYEDLRASGGTGLSAMEAFRWPTPLRVWPGTDAPVMNTVSSVSGGLFGLLGNRALLGRVIQPSDDSAGARVAVLGHALWQTRYGGSRSALGQTLVIEGQTYEIVGVMGPEFEFPVPAADLFVPIRRVPAMEDRDTRFMGVIGRLEDGVPLEAARRRAASAMDVLVARWPENRGNGLRLDPLRSVVLGDAEPVMAVLLGAVVLLLLLSCASVGNLLLARTAAREPELAMRRALGAGRGRLLTLLLGESLALAVTGGAAGLLLAMLATRLLSRVVPASLPRASSIGFDLRTYGFAAAAAVTSGILFGLAPALRGSSATVMGALRRTAGGVTGRARNGVLRGLVIVQIAITVVLLAGAGLLANSFVRLVGVDSGLDPEGVVTLRISLPAEYEDPRRVDGFYEELLQRASAVPGVTAAGATWALPFTRDWASGRVTVEGDPRPRDEELLVGLIPVRGRYFAATGMRLVEGRLFESSDYGAARAALAMADSEPSGDAPGMAVINQAAAAAMWPTARSVVGKRFRRGRADEDGPWITVIGVVRDAKRFDLSRNTEPEVYQMHPTALWARDMSLVVRSGTDPLSLIGPLTDIVHDLDSSLAVARAGLLDELVRRSIAEPRFRTLLLVAFGLASLILALTGVYGVLAFAVSLRTREIGVRMALGAGRARVLADVVRDGALVVAVGIALGLPGALAGTGALRSQLFGIGRFDPTTWSAIVLLVAIAGLAAAWVPARRASRVDPAVAMRE